MYFFFIFLLIFHFLLFFFIAAVFFADPATRLETNGDGELVPQRRERYVFRPILIKILEGFFAQSPFPDLNKRVEIATTCNQVLQIEKRGTYHRGKLFRGH